MRAAKYLMAKNGYTTLNLPTALVEELKIWRMAYNTAYAKTVSYAEMIRGMLDSLKDIEPGVFSELRRIVDTHPELQDKIGRSTLDAKE